MGACESAAPDRLLESKRPDLNVWLFCCRGAGGCLPPGPAIHRLTVNVRSRLVRDIGPFIMNGCVRAELLIVGGHLDRPQHIRSTESQSLAAPGFQSKIALVRVHVDKYTRRLALNAKGNGSSCRIYAHRARHRAGFVVPGNAINHVV